MKHLNKDDELIESFEIILEDLKERFGRLSPTHNKLMVVVQVTLQEHTMQRLNRKEMKREMF